MSGEALRLAALAQGISLEMAAMSGEALDSLRSLRAFSLEMACHER